MTNERNISSRSYAKVGDYVIVSGNHGASAAGLWLLKKKGEMEKGKEEFSLIQSHLMPEMQKDFSNEISTKIKRNYAMMDTSDGLADALFKIAKASDVIISVDFDKIPYDKTIETVASQANIDFKDWVLYGGEDYKIVACIDEDNLRLLHKTSYKIIGRVAAKEENHFVEVVFDDKIETIANLEKTFNHFKE